MQKIRSISIAGVTILLYFLFAGCNNQHGGRYGDNSSDGDHAITDTLSNDLQFAVTLEGKTINIDSAHINTAFNRNDSLVDITTRWDDTTYLVFTIPVKKETPFDVPTAYKAARNKAFDSEEWVPNPTVALYNYPSLNVNFNNLNDGNSAGEVKPGVIHISSLRLLPGGNNSDGWTYLLKGTFNTLLLKNVYNGSTKPYNRDYPVKGKFVVKLNTSF